MKVEVKDGRTYIDGELVGGKEVGPVTITDGRNTISIGKITSGGSSASGSKFEEAMKKMDVKMEAARTGAEAAVGGAGTGAAGVRIEGMRTAGKAQIYVDGTPFDLEGKEGVTRNPNGSRDITIKGSGVVHFGRKEKR